VHHVMGDLAVLFDVDLGGQRRPGRADADGNRAQAARRRRRRWNE
jgi:hypothetical protein